MSRIMPGDTVYIVKHALSNGIEKKEVVNVSHAASVQPFDMVSFGGINWYRVGRDVFTNKPDAVGAAYRLRDKAIIAAKKRIAELEKLSFKEEE